MSTVLQTGALLCTALGLLSAAAVLLSSRDGRLTVRVLLEFLLAAGLLRLSAAPSFEALAAAAAVVALRRLLALGLRPAHAA